MAKTDEVKISAAELDKLRADREALIEFAVYMKGWGRFNDHGIKCRAVAALEKAGAE